jgi:type IV secretory pathway component VirB8
MKNFFQKWTRKFQAKELKQARSDRSTLKSEDYFQNARHWSDDIYMASLVSRNRYRAAFYGMSGLVGLMAITIAILVPLQHTELVVVHEGQSGYTWLSTTKAGRHPEENWGRTQAEIAHYVQTRASYDPLLYRYQVQEVKRFSSPQVQAEYDWSQSKDQKFSPVNVLGVKGYRTVQVNSILKLDDVAESRNKKDLHSNLAQVSYLVTDHFVGSSETISVPYLALISWEELGVPEDPEQKLQNWDGFTVTKFQTQAVSLPKTVD